MAKRKVKKTGESSVTLPDQVIDMVDSDNNYVYLDTFDLQNPENDNYLYRPVNESFERGGAFLSPIYDDAQFVDYKKHRYYRLADVYTYIPPPPPVRSRSVILRGRYSVATEPTPTGTRVIFTRAR